MSVLSFLNSGSSVSVLTGTLAQMNATTGTNGQFFYNTTYNSYFKWVNDAWDPEKPDPRYGYMEDDEFMGATVASKMPWGNNTTGTGNAINVTPANTSYGELILECTAAGQTANFRDVLANVLLGGADHYCEFLLRVPTLATVAEDFSVGWGWQDNAAYDANTLCTDGVWGTLNRAINGTNIVMNSASNSSRTATNASATAISAGVTFRARIAVYGTTSAEFFINGVSQGTVSSNLPTGAGRYTGFQLKLDKHNGTGASQVVIDHVRRWGYFTTRRAA